MTHLLNEKTAGLETCTTGLLVVRTSRSAAQLYFVWSVMTHLLYAAVKGISDSVLWPDNQHFSAAFAPDTVSPQAALSINEKAAGRETCTTGLLVAQTSRSAGQLHFVWPVMTHLLYAAVNGISDSVLWPGNQYFSAAFDPYNVRRKPL